MPLFRKAGRFQEFLERMEIIKKLREKDIKKERKIEK
jgi:hypothetical protein